jgi:glycosyltransferase involved in cell wall biosynthesis
MISVVIPTRDRQEILGCTLERLSHQDLAPDEYEILIVDDGSQRDTDSVVAQAAQSCLAEMRLVHQTPSRGPAAARNRGVREARGELVLFIGDDLWAQTDLLSTHTRFHQNNPQPQAALLGRVDQSPEMPKDPFNLWFRPFAFHLLEGKTRADWRFFWTSNLSLKRKFLLDNGLFDEEFPFAAHEDVELGYRLSACDLQLFYEPRPLGEHYHPRTLREACHSQWQNGATFVILERKVPEAELRAQYGIFSWKNQPFDILRFGARQILFNRLTVPLLVQWMEKAQSPSAWANWMYWKVLMHFMQRGYAESPYR